MFERSIGLIRMCVITATVVEIISVATKIVFREILALFAEKIGEEGVFSPKMML